MSKCQHCKEDLQGDGFGQQRQVEMFRKWLCDVTCITWLHAHSGDPTPTCDQGQYGVIEVEFSKIMATPTQVTTTYEHVSAIDENGDPLQKHCCVMRFTEHVNFSLRVYGDSGVFTDCEGAEHSSNAPHRTDMDVLKFIRLMTYKDSIGANTTFVRGDGLIDMERTEQGGMLCPRNAFMSIGIDFCTQASFPTDGSLFHWCAFTCKGKPLCIEKPTCKE